METDEDMMVVDGQVTDVMGDDVMDDDSNVL